MLQQRRRHTLNMCTYSLQYTQNKNSKERQEYWSRKYLNTRKTKYIKNESSVYVHACVSEYERKAFACVCV